MLGGDENEDRWEERVRLGRWSMLVGRKLRKMVRMEEDVMEYMLYLGRRHRLGRCKDGIELRFM